MLGNLFTGSCLQWAGQECCSKQECGTLGTVPFTKDWGEAARDPLSAGGVTGLKLPL